MLDYIWCFLNTPSAWFALFSWPKYSLTSHRLILSLRQQGIRPHTVIDVGANVGQFTIACAKLYVDATVYSFEPHPKCVEKLRRNTANLGGVHVCPVALGATSGEVSFHINSHSHSSSILALGERHRKAFPHAREISTITVPLSTLDREMKMPALEGPVLLKVDVQGYETQVLAGATETLKKVDYVLLETSFRPLYEGERTFIEIIRMMELYGFEFLRPVDWLKDPSNGEVLQADALFVNRNRRE